MIMDLQKIMSVIVILHIIHPYAHINEQCEQLFIYFFPYVMFDLVIFMKIWFYVC